MSNLKDREAFFAFLLFRPEAIKKGMLANAETAPARTTVPRVPKSVLPPLTLMNAIAPAPSRSSLIQPQAGTLAPTIGLLRRFYG